MKDYTLNLTPGFKPFNNIPSLKIEALQFPMGEPNVKLIKYPKKEIQDLIVTSRIQTGDDIWKLACAMDIVKRQFTVREVSLFIPYFPGARQDRALFNEALTAKVTANMINAIYDFNAIATFDAHSDVTTAVLNNGVNFTNHRFVHEALLKIISKDDFFHLIIPDYGASKKAVKLAECLYKKGWSFEVVQGIKHRDMITGKLSGFGLTKTDFENTPAIIVDDICDGGGTFIGLASKIEFAHRIHLIVSHGGFTKGTKDLLACFDTISCTDSYWTPKLNTIGINVIPLNTVL